MPWHENYPHRDSTKIIPTLSFNSDLICSTDTLSYAAYIGVTSLFTLIYIVYIVTSKCQSLMYMNTVSLGLALQF